MVAAQPCVQPGATETVTFTLDGRQRQATFDGCGHQTDEPVDILVTGDGPTLVVRAAGAATGGHDGRGLGLLLLALSGVAGAGYFLLVRRGPRGTPLPVLGRLEWTDLVPKSITVVRWRPTGRH